MVPNVLQVKLIYVLITGFQQPSQRATQRKIHNLFFVGGQRLKNFFQELIKEIYFEACALKETCLS